jgi:hypothetical protein
MENFICIFTIQFEINDQVIKKVTIILITKLGTS